MSPLVLVLAAALPAPDAHSLANPAVVRPTHVALDLTVGFADKTIRGEALLTLEYPQGEEKADHLDLDTRELRIEEVTDETTHQPLTFTLEAPVKLLGQRLRIALPQRRPAQVRIAYRTVPEATALQWLEPRQTTSGKLPFLFTQSQSIHARSWVPCMDSPGVRLTYEAVIRVPSGTTAVMAAEAGTHEPDKGIFRFKMPQPIPPYLFALVGRRDREAGRGTAHRRLRGAGRAREGGLGVRGDGEDGGSGGAPLRALRAGAAGTCWCCRPASRSAAWRTRGSRSRRRPSSPATAA